MYQAVAEALFLPYRPGFLLFFYFNPLFPRHMLILVGAEGIHESSPDPKYGGNDSTFSSAQSLDQPVVSRSLY